MYRLGRPQKASVDQRLELTSKKKEVLIFYSTVGSIALILDLELSGYGTENSLKSKDFHFSIACVCLHFVNR